MGRLACSPEILFANDDTRGTGGKVNNAVTTMLRAARWLEDRRQRIVVASTHDELTPRVGAAHKEHCMRWSALVCAGTLVAAGCAPASGQVLHSSAGDFVVQTAAKGLDHPWALAFLPDRRLLVTER